MATTTRAPRTSRRKAAEPATDRPKADPTRAKLLDAATEVFAERGYYATTVREISQRAGTNIASVNYYFRDKLGLYTEVLRRAVSSVGLAARAEFERDLPPEQALRAAVKVFLSRLYGRDRPSVPFRLMRHELSQPTPAMSQVVNEVMRPNYDRLRAAVGSILGLPPDHETTRLCAHSIMGQVLFYPMTAPVMPIIWPQLKVTPERLDDIANHIVNFSLAYLRSARAKP